jgi:pSer/pThr/pTyr-binding forkhead associated (FHA) protein
MKTVTFQVLEGVDKGRVFRSLPVPVTIGREEGNILRLNDERISRYHAKVQQDHDDVILTDLDSTNGTRVNGAPVQIRRLRPGDQISLGRSTLLFGSHEEILARKAALESAALAKSTSLPPPLAPTIVGTLSKELSPEAVKDVAATVSDWLPSPRELPPLPQRLAPAQAARLAEILDFLHRGLTSALENLQSSEDAVQVRLPYSEWQKIQIVQLFLARYLRGIADPDSLDD